jgi:hypothetical protein
MNRIIRNPTYVFVNNGRASISVCVALCGAPVQTVMLAWGLFDRASSSLNKVKCQLDANRWFYWCNLNSTCFGYIRPSSGALDVELQHVVFCTELLDGWWFWEPLRSDSQDHHPSKNSVQKTICCNPTSNVLDDGRMYPNNAPDDGRMYPKHVELRIHQ